MSEGPTGIEVPPAAQVSDSDDRRDNLAAFNFAPYTSSNVKEEPLPLLLPWWLGWLVAGRFRMVLNMLSVPVEHTLLLCQEWLRAVRIHLV